MPDFSPYPTFNRLGDISIDTFLCEYWQKKPLLIRRAFTDFVSPLDADELAGLSMEDDVISRLAIGDSSQRHWQVQHGPFAEDVFSALPDQQPWTLLVQGVDALVPNVNDLLNAFRFIPNWRLDDIMVSYAPDTGGVGPHFDYFDVFLLQGSGKRRWRTGQFCDASNRGLSALVPEQPMKILQDFVTDNDWIVEPGDLLYIPAQCAHWGEAIGDSITYSIGFRSPSHADITLDYAQECAIQYDESNRYTDKDLSVQDNCGEIAPEAIEKISEFLQQLANDKHAIGHWLGQYSTQLKQDYCADELPLNLCDVQAFYAGAPIQLLPFARAAFYTTDNTKKQQTIPCFINGESYPLTHKLAKRLCGYQRFTCHDLTEQEITQLDSLLQHKLLIIAD